MNANYDSRHEFGPRGYNAAETQTPPSTENQPDDARKFGPHEQAALLERDRLGNHMREQHVDPAVIQETMRKSLRYVHEARLQDEQAEKDQRAHAARTDAQAAYDQQEQPTGSTPETPYPVHTTATMGQRPVRIHTVSAPKPQAQSDLQGPSLRDQVKHHLDNSQ